MRLIDADAFEANMQNEWERCEISNGEWIRFREMINDEPTIDIEERLNDAYAHGWSDAEAKYHDAVEVVRCKVCKYRRTEDCPMCNECGKKAYPTADNDFCSFGERKERASR